MLYELTAGGISEAVPAPARPKIILFARPCDARAIQILDKLFLDDCRDEPYAARRENTLIIGLSCPEPDSKCFCLSLSGGPFDSKGLDASICRIGPEDFLVGLETGRADAMFKGHGREAGPEALKKAGEIKKQAEGRILKKINIPADMAQKYDSD